MTLYNRMKEMYAMCEAITCQGCGATNPVGQDWCKACQGPLSAAAIEELETESSVRLEHAPKTGEALRDEAEENFNFRVKRLVRILVILVLLGVSGCVVSVGARVLIHHYSLAGRIVGEWLNKEDGATIVFHRGGYYEHRWPKGEGENEYAYESSGGGQSSGEPVYAGPGVSGNNYRTSGDLLYMTFGVISKDTLELRASIRGDTLVLKFREPTRSGGVEGIYTRVR